eukprot:CAMPEP_0171060312 /NCGR_PEP_ID=MMETSP0766_2-20121228/3753_1 /TAXON_ID=439317 /ORGANISM="Gambierdiscus australes, Strain CAWD 149" /LENGTH=236 /DNA_ID=CAMNT_0011515873 /DNA_START=38 /DNA_END=748 /DNA_ORIENTATION=-
MKVCPPCRGPAGPRDEVEESADAPQVQRAPDAEAREASEGPPRLQLEIQRLNGDGFQLGFDTASVTVASVKMRIEAVCGTPAACQRLTMLTSSSGPNLGPHKLSPGELLTADCTLILTVVKVHKVDDEAPDCWDVHEDYTVRLKQVSATGRSDRFCVLQVLTSQRPRMIGLWTRWGCLAPRGRRAGDEMHMQYFANESSAVKEFEAQFLEMTQNLWSQIGSFSAVEGKFFVDDTGK